MTTFETVASFLRAKNLTLPYFLTRENKTRYALFLGASTLLLYLASNHFHAFPPQLLPLSWIDHAVPFLPESVWVYMSEYVFFFVVYFTAKDLKNINRWIYSFFALQIISAFVFWIWPTTYPRANFPLPADLDAVTHFVFTSLRTTDTPANCAPSLHVSSCYLSAFLFLDEQREKFPLFFLWATAITLSTLTTKQHYLMDGVLGLGLAMVVYWFFHRVVSYRTVVPSAEAGDHAKR